MKYGIDACVGNLPVFSRNGAVEAYKVFVRMFDKEMSMEASVVLGNATDDMVALGFTREECEEIEIEACVAC